MPSSRRLPAGPWPTARRSATRRARQEGKAMPLRFLIIEGNTRQVRERAAAGFGRTPSQSYAAAVQEIAPEAVCDIAFPADEGATLPDPAGLESYDAVFITGSALNVYDLEPAV